MHIHVFLMGKLQVELLLNVYFSQYELTALFSISPTSSIVMIIWMCWCLHTFQTLQLLLTH